MSRFIPGYHFEPAEKKLTPEWCSEVMNDLYYNNRLIGLLAGKDIETISGYAEGEYSLKPFKRMFTSLRKQEAVMGNNNIRREDIERMDKTGIQWDCVPLIPPKLNSAIATTQKIPFEITCTCIDPLAQKKRDEDLEFLKNKPVMEQVLQPLYDSMNLGKVDFGPTQHSSIPYNALPMDLDIEDEEEFRMFASLIYNLAPEAAIENILQHYYSTKKIIQTRLLETKDQYYYAVSVNRGFPDKITGLPNIEYHSPEVVETDRSNLPDYSDNLIRVVNMWVTPMELFKYFPNEICNEESLEKIVNGGGEAGAWGTGYCGCNKRNAVTVDNWGTFKMNLKLVEIKSVDSIGVGQKKKSNYKYFTDTTDPHCVDKIWAQNTYQFYWLVNTKWYFGIDRLGFAHRSQGEETYQNFSTNIYKSQAKSAVELCIGENKKAQMADIKLQHAIIMSAPNGKIIDMKYIRNAIEGLTGEMGKWTEKDLLDKAMEQNVHIIDTAGFEGRETGQFLPVKDLPGGLKEDIFGYYRVRIEADKNISAYTGINEQLTAQSANPEGLVGLQKLLVNGSINNIYYVNEALLAQYQSLFNMWAWCVQQAIARGGKVKQAIVNIIGKNKVATLKAMDDIPIHQIGTKLTLGLREEERAQFKYEIAQLRAKGILTAADEYYIINTPNPKDALWLIAMAEKKFNKRQDKIRAEQYAAQQQMAQQQGQNMLQNTQAQTDGKIQQIQAEGDVEGKLLQLGSQLGMSEKQIEGLIKLQLQKQRLEGATEKSLKTIYANKQLEAQAALT